MIDYFWRKRLVPTILGIWGQIEILLWENEVDYFRVRLRGCPLLTLGNPPKILRDDQGKISPLVNLPRILTRRVCSRMIQEDEEPPLEKQHQSKNAFINITIR
jgi:hypothetical protein